MCLRQKIYCDSNSTKNVGYNNSYSNSTSSLLFELTSQLCTNRSIGPKFGTHYQHCVHQSYIFVKNVWTPDKSWEPGILKFECYWKLRQNLKNSKVTHSHSLTLSFYHSLAILLSHSLSLDMLNNFCLFLISLVDFLSLRNVRRNKMMIDDLGWIYCKTLLQNLPEPMIFGTCSWQRDWLLQIYRVHLSEPEGGVTNSQSKYRGCRKPTVFATNTGTSI